MRTRRLVAVLCSLVAGLVPAGPAAAGGASVSFLIPVGNVSLPESLAGGSIGGLATDASGNVYAGVNLAGEAFVAVFDPAGTFLRQWQTDPLLTSRDAVVLAVGPDGLVYVAPSGSAGGDELVRVFAADGTPVRAFGQGSGLRDVTDIELDPAGNVYVTARARPDLGLPDDMIVRFDPAGNLAARLVPAPGQPGQFASALKGLAVGPDGSLYVTSGFDGVVRLDQAGARLPVPDFAFVIPGDRHFFEDVDVANGNLYLAGDFVETRGRNPFGVAVLTPQGKVLDLVVGQGDEVAVAGSELYATGVHGLRSPAARTVATHIAGEFGHVRHNGVRPTDASTGTGYALGDDCTGSHYRDPSSGITRFVLPRSGGCSVFFQNLGSPCPPGTLHPTPRQAYSDGYPVGSVRVVSEDIFVTLGNPPLVNIEIPPSDVRSGPVVVEWECDDQFGYDWKGSIDLVDPSGTVLDVRTGRPVDRATVRLQFSLRKGGPFGAPGVAGFSPQTNPQVTGPDGAFGWDVAPGFWRLKIAAFGYRPLTSPVYSVPPEVTGLRLELQPDPRQQARLLDPYAGRAGTVRLGARLAQGTRVPGLVLRAAGGKLRTITVKAKRFRTAAGIALGSSETALRDAYTREVTAALRKAKRPSSKYKIGKATFTVKRGRVAGIVLGR